MDSRFNLGEGFSISHGNELNSWMPVTPEKLIPTSSNSMPIERHENRSGKGNWQELAGFPSGCVQEVSDYSTVAQNSCQIGQLGRNGSFPEKNRMINHIAGSYSQALRNESEIWKGNCSFTDLLAMKSIADPHAFPNRNLKGSMSMAERPLVPNLHSLLDDLGESNSGELLVANRTHDSSSNLLSSNQGLCQLPQFGFPIPQHPNYGINSLPRTKAEAALTFGNSVQFTSVTPEQANKLQEQLSATVTFPQEKCSSAEREKRCNLVVSVDDYPKENSSNELVHNIADSSSAVTSTPFEEPKDSSKGSDEAVELNQTPQQKSPKRRKHRPKVIKEVKPSRTPRAATTKTAESKTTEKRKYVRKKVQQESTTPQPDTVGETNDSMEKPKAKRRYVRKKSLQEPAIKSGDCIHETTYLSSEPQAPSCRKALNFDKLESNRCGRENNLTAQQETLNKEKETSILSTGFQVAESINKTNMMCGTKSDSWMNRQSELPLENQQSRATSNLTSSMNKLPDNSVSISNRAPYISISDRSGAVVQLASMKDVHMNNLNASFNPRETNIRMQQHIHAFGIGRTAFTEKLSIQNTPQSVPEISLDFTEGRGSNRRYCHVEQTDNYTASPPDKLLSQEISHTHSHLCNQMSSTDCSESCDKKKPLKGIQTDTNHMLPPAAAVNYSRSRINLNDFNSIASTSQRNSEMLNSYYGSNYFKRRENNGSDRLAVDWHTYLMASRQDLSKQHMLSGQNSCTERIEGRNISNRVQNLACLTSIENNNMVPPTPPKTHPQPGNKLQLKMCNIDVSRKQELVPFGNGRMLQEQTDMLKDLQSPARRKGRHVKHKHPATIEEIIYLMQGLTLNERRNKMKGKEQNALVLYKGDGTLVPHQGSKKHKPRPKVDLDPETERVWKLLMWKEGSEGLDGIDEEKQRWWEEERRIFRGRADSFIARMHLVQGDRRFSKWKGSVLDSVIGVFLTQNVSDHLSSSAFMSLAAKFPLKSSRNRAYERDRAIILVEKLFHPFYSQISMTLHESTEPWEDSETSRTEKTSAVEVHNHSPEEEVMSSQDSFDSSVTESNGVRSYSGSNSEEEDPANRCKCCKNPSTSSTNLLQVRSTSLLEEFYSHDSGRSLCHEGSKHVHKQPEDIENTINIVNLNINSLKARKEKAEDQKKDAVDWDSLRKQALANGKRKERSPDTMDSMDYEAMRCSSVTEIAQIIKKRGMNNLLAGRIQDFLHRMVQEHGSIDLEWLRDVPPDKAKDYLLSIRGLGLKSVECVRLLTLHHLAFPVDTNVGRIAVRLGWVPLQPLPESLQLHLLELYPVLESIQKYLWPRLCKLDQRTLYELHYQLITFGKVFCTKSRPNCNACPMRAECRHFASAFASARLALPGPEEKSIVPSTVAITTEKSPGVVIDPLPLAAPGPEENSLKRGGSDIVSCEPIIEEPATPEQQQHGEVIESDIEDLFDGDPDEIPTIKLNVEELSVTIQNYLQANMELQEGDMSKALVALNPEAAIPMPKLKNISQLRTEHQVYELPDSHPLLKGIDKREPDDPSPYLLAIWKPGETANSSRPPDQHCQSQEPNKLCNSETCFPCNSVREANSQTVRGTLLIPCRTAMRGSFPLNGTYFQVNEVFADHESSLHPINVPRAWIWNLPRRIVYFGTSVNAIFRGLSTEGIQYCFWKGFVCVRGFEQKTRAPKPLLFRLHYPASWLVKTREERD